MLSSNFKNKNNQDTITIGFMGDVMIGRLVNEIIDLQGYAYPWGNTLPLLQSVDIRILNLETTLTQHTQKVSKVFNFKATPDRIKILQLAHIDIVNLANNHSLDFETQGLFETIQTLDDAHIQHVGAGKNIHEAKSPVIITKNNIKIGVIGYTDNEPTWKAENHKPGINYIQVGDMKNVKKDIAPLKNNVDIIIATIHWGPNMRQKPSDEFIEFAHQMIDAGIDIIHGHSSHVFQGIEIYKNKVIMYDTGDFIDDYAVNPVLRNDFSFFFKVTLNKNGPLSISLTPVVIKDMQVNSITTDQKNYILNLMQKLSQPFNTTIRENGTIFIQ